jgi:hypothetical protein
LPSGSSWPRGRSRTTSKAIFHTTGTCSRRELRTQIFFEEYLPAFVLRAPLDADGALVRQGHG